jgi:hypothetical protein
MHYREQRPVGSLGTINRGDLGEVHSKRLKLFPDPAEAGHSKLLWIHRDKDASDLDDLYLTTSKTFLRIDPLLQQPQQQCQTFCSDSEFILKPDLIKKNLLVFFLLFFNLSQRGKTNDRNGANGVNKSA